MMRLISSIQSSSTSTSIRNITQTAYIMARFIPPSAWVFMEDLKYDTGDTTTAPVTSSEKKDESIDNSSDATSKADGSITSNNGNSKAKSKTVSKTTGVAATAVAASEKEDKNIKKKIFCGYIKCRKEQVDNAKTSRCSRCKMVYCGKECQMSDWKMNHKDECSNIDFINRNRNGDIIHDPNGVQVIQLVMDNMLRSIRMYLCPFATVKQDAQGAGIVFLQTASSLREMAFAAPRDQDGTPLSRFVQLQFKGLDEWDELAFENDFELASARSCIAKVLNEYDKDKEIVVVILLACGLLLIVSYYFYCCMMVGICTTYSLLFLLWCNKMFLID